MPPSVRYDRAPSERLMNLLRPEGFLEPLIGLNERTVRVAESDVHLDVHFRRDDKVDVYCGLTVILTVNRQKNGSVVVSAKDDEYKKQKCAARLFRIWRGDEPAFRNVLDAYLGEVKVNPTHTKKEGAVQLNWSRVTEPWTQFDREARLKYESTSHREEAKKVPEVEASFDAIEAEARQEKWAEPRKPKSFSEVDQLAVDSDGRLVLIELKNTSANDDKVYYAPFQLLQYVWEWHNALEAVRDDLQKLIDARKTAGLATNTHRLTGGIRAAVGFGHDCRSVEVKRRYRKVLQIVNRHLPCNVPDIETWEHADNGPRQIDPDPGQGPE